METLYSWLIVFSGATIAFLGSFLFVSERELRNLRREFDEFKRKQTGKPVQSSTEEARSEAHASLEQVADVESREMIYREQQQRLEELVVDLERELSEGKNQVQALEDTHERLQETERVCQELSDENRRLGEEIARWQERFASSEENQTQVSMLRQQLEELQTEHARLLDEKHQAQTRIASVTEEMSSETMISKTNPLNDSSNETRGEKMYPSSGDAAGGIRLAKKEESSWVVWTSLKQKWRFGAVPAIVIVVIAGAAALGLLGTPFSPSKEVAVAPATSSDEYPAKPVERVSKPQPKMAPRVRGTFETVRATQVYSGPSENSALIASIGPGTKLNVVDSSNGWLEVRSKHGRPPGFVRREAAVRSGQN